MFYFDLLVTFCKRWRFNVKLNCYITSSTTNEYFKKSYETLNDDPELQR